MFYFTLTVSCLLLPNSTLVAICLSDYDDFVRFIFDIYAGSGDSLEPPQEGSTGRNNSCQTINLQQYSEVLKTILPRHIKER